MGLLEEKQKLFTLRGIKFKEKKYFLEIAKNIPNSYSKNFFILEKTQEITPKTLDANGFLVNQVETLAPGKDGKDKFKKGMITCNSCGVKLTTNSVNSKLKKSHFKIIGPEHKEDCNYIKSYTKKWDGDISSFYDFKNNKNSLSEYFKNASYNIENTITIEFINDEYFQINNCEGKVNKERQGERFNITNNFLIKIRNKELQRKMSLRENNSSGIKGVYFSRFPKGTIKTKLFEEEYEININFNKKAYEKIEKNKMYNYALIASNGFISTVQNPNSIFNSKEIGMLVDEKNIIFTNEDF